VKRKYTGQRLNFTTSTEARFALGVIAQSGNAGRQDDLRKFLDIPPLPAECSNVLQDVDSERQRKKRNGEWNRKEYRRKKNETRNELRAGTGRDSKGEDDYYFRQDQEVASN
jgi:hypothetical protein